MKNNLGMADRFIRLLIGIILLIFLFKTSLILLGILLIVTAFASFCPIYKFMDISTNKNSTKDNLNTPEAPTNSINIKTEKTISLEKSEKK